MIGTWINVAAILIGGAIGALLGGRLPERLRQTVMAGLGLFTLLFAIRMFMQTGNALVVLCSLLFGALLGEWWKIEDGVENLGAWLEKRFNRSTGGGDKEKFVRGFLTASLLFCVGPVAILGSIQDGMTGDYQTLAIKSVLDGFASIAFASSMGVGVMFSALPILIYQGAITLLAVQVQSVMSAEMTAEMTAAGGVILAALAISSLLEVKKIRSGNFLPALIFAPLLVLFFKWLGIY